MTVCGLPHPCLQGALRTKETIESFKRVPAQPGQTSPLLVYFGEQRAPRGLHSVLTAWSLHLLMSVDLLAVLTSGGCPWLLLRCDSASLPRCPVLRSPARRHHPYQVVAQPAGECGAGPPGDEPEQEAAAGQLVEGGLARWGCSLLGSFAAGMVLPIDSASNPASSL